MAGELAGVAGALTGLLQGAAGRPLGLPENARAAVVAALALQVDGSTLLVVSTAARAQATVEEVALFLDGAPLARLPEREGLPYEFARDESLAGVERARALNILASGGRGLVVASWAALSEHRAGPSAASGAIAFAVGQAMAPAALLRDLEAMGYAVSHLAEQPGMASHRGGIVDVFPTGSLQPLRIEFLGDEIESIRLIDIATQRSIGRVPAARVEPVAIGTRTARDAARRLVDELQASGDLADAVIEQLELVAAGERSDYEGFLEPLLYESSGLDHCSTAGQVLVDEEEEGLAALERQVEHEDRTRDELERRGSVPAGLPRLRVGPAVVSAWLAGRVGVTRLQRFGTEELGAYRLDLHVTPSFAGKLRPLALQCGEWAKAGKTVVIASQQALRLAEIMDGEGIRATLKRKLEVVPGDGEIVVVPTAAGGGFTAGERLILVTDAEIFGFRKRRRPTRTRTGVRDDLVSTLEVGDHLVHADHGIARYGGMVRRSLEGVEREYLELQYAEGDRIYVPADQLESVSRYVGPADGPPSLTRLGSQDWVRAKRRVRQAVVELAQELLDLYARRELAQGHAFSADGAWQMEMEAAFPFVETPEQLQAISEVKADMERERPMDRLICGDVGYGKTEVAIRAAFKAVADGKQVAVLVPTTVLAEQHGETFRERTAGFPVRVEVLSRFRSDHEQREIVAGIRSGEIDIAVGTHRLLGRDVDFKDLGLVVIDEEQRFGVSHKERLKQMRAEVDTLTLSATPIPRTLQMSLAGIRDMSTIMTPPEERLPIRTYVLQWDNEIIREAIERETERGGQVFFVHNRVHNIERIVTRLREIVPGAEIAVGHGQMPEEQLERVMLEFGAGEKDILVCTTIIESGLDIPNANTIIINNADQLGLAQLYQLRGRVGRGANRAYAYLLHEKDRTINEHAQKRLEAIFEATELGAGFQIALRDLEIRGAGNVLGNEQSGHIAAVGFDMYSKLVADAVNAIKASYTGDAPPPRLPPVPSVDLPVSAHIPENYVADIHDRLNVYQRIAAIDSAEGVAAMQAELRDRFGAVPPVVENLLYVSLLKSVARRAGVESIKTDEHMFHLRVRGGVPEEMRRRVEGLGSMGLLVGPNQVRVDRVSAGTNWMPLLVKVVRTMAGPA